MLKIENGPIYVSPTVSRRRSPDAFAEHACRAIRRITMWIRPSVFLPVIFAFLATPALADEAWSLSGLKEPESALFDSQRKVIYVSNVAGEANAKDGIGFISKVSPDGKLIELEWVKGLNGPKGLVMNGNRLYVSDIDQLVEIDVDKGQVTNRWKAEGSKFLNDTAVDGNGRVYVSDMLADSIYVLDGGKLSVFLQDKGLLHPNGLRVEGDKLLVAAWGADIQPDFTTKTPGHLLSVDLKSKAISDVGNGKPVGNLDGLESDGAGNWIVTDWIDGALYRLHSDGKADRLLDLNKGSADLEFLEQDKIAIIPMMIDGKVTAYKIQ
jgi:sugar lactone lactonase YvrE